MLGCWLSAAACRNLAGHHTITGDLPAEWYDQAAFPKLYYLKLKGTGIQPNLTSTNLKWQAASEFGSERKVISVRCCTSAVCSL
jgi:hypothetical protein